METSGPISHQIAEYAMALDLCSELTQELDEQQVLHRILDIFTALFAPEQIVFRVMEGGSETAVLTRPETVKVPADLPPNADLPEMLPAGFRLRIPSRDETIGIIEVNGLAFPEHRDRYLSLALALAGVCGLAVSNARTHSRLGAVLSDLRKEYARSSRLSEELGGVNADLRNRVRELDGLYGIARLVETSPTTAALLQSIADFLPSSWEHATRTCARVVIDDKVYTSAGFRESSRVLEAPVIVHAKNRGKIGIFLPEEDPGRKPVVSGNETALLSAIAERVGRVLERREAEEALASLNRELESRVVQRTAELNAEIAQRKAAEESIRASLREKELLLREVHHRVKNNLQLISSILSFQGRKVADPSLRMALSESRNRIRTISYIHENLWTAQDLSRISLDGIARQIPANLLSLYRLPSDSVRVSVNTGGAVMDINTAIPLALVINELFSNSLKHAFPGGRTGEIGLDIRRDGDELVVRFTDNGTGLPEGYDWENPETVGFVLITSLVQQLQGTIVREPGAGTRFLIRVPAPGGGPGDLRGTYNRLPD